MTDQNERWCCSGNAEDCRLCDIGSLPYPWICPGHPDTPENREKAKEPSAPSLREQMVAALEDYPVACWTPGNLASRLLSVIGADLEAGREAQRKVQRLDQMATAWKERLPETINRDTVVDAVHQVTRGDAG